MKESSKTEAKINPYLASQLLSKDPKIDTKQTRNLHSEITLKNINAVHAKTDGNLARAEVTK